MLRETSHNEASAASDATVKKGELGEGNVKNDRQKSSRESGNVRSKESGKASAASERQFVSI